jgi:hypothetical protein
MSGIGMGCILASESFVVPISTVHSFPETPMYIHNHLELHVYIDVAPIGLISTLRPQREVAKASIDGVGQTQHDRCYTFPREAFTTEQLVHLGG